MTRAERALASARLLLDADDTDGACNRAYYAMFDAARASLMVADAPPETIGTKTHGGLIAAFSLHVVKRGLVGPDLGRALNRLHELRMIADYRGDVIERAQAQDAIADATAFLAAIAALMAGC